ncbi:hypothetical protein EBU94_08150, partial [bacterium]|nr:hypothetical protein [bacterium]
MPYTILKVPKSRCYEVINPQTQKVHSQCTTKKKAEAQIRLLENLDQKGEGIIDEAKKLYDRLLPQRKAGVLRPKSRKLLSQVSQEPITSLEVVRTPIESYINTVLNAISLGKFTQAVQSLGYDKLFHLSLFINKKYVFHKIEVLTFDVAPNNLITSKSEVQNVPLPSTAPTIGDLIEKTKQYMGDDKFTSYSAVTNNCQDLVLSTLRANNLLNSQLQTFIKQDSESIFKKLPSFVGKFTEGVTDVAGRFNRLVEGEGTNFGFGFAIRLPQTTRDYIHSMDEKKVSGRGKRSTQVEPNPSPLQLHTILVPKSEFKKKQAYEWLNTHNFHTDKYRTTKNFHRFNQILAVKGSQYYTKILPNGIE